MPDPVDDGGQEFDTGHEPGIGDAGLEPLPGEDDGTPPEEIGEPTEEPWRAAIGEAMAGLTAEVRQTLGDFSSEMKSSSDRRFDEMSRRIPQPQPTPRQEPPSHEFDDPISLMEAGADPRMARFFKVQRARDQATLDQIKELQNRINESEKSSAERRRNDELATHYGGQIQHALKANELTADAEELDPIMQPLTMGLALLAPRNDPRGADVAGTVKRLETYVQKRIKRDRDEREEAARAQAGIPAPPPPGQATRPAVKRGEIKSMQDADREFDALLARWPDEEGPPE